MTGARKRVFPISREKDLMLVMMPLRLTAPTSLEVFRDTMAEAVASGVPEIVLDFMLTTVADREILCELGTLSENNQGAFSLWWQNAKPEVANLLSEVKIGGGERLPPVIIKSSLSGPQQKNKERLA
jgi:hypothetical protein